MIYCLNFIKYAIGVLKFKNKQNRDKKQVGVELKFAKLFLGWLKNIILLILTNSYLKNLMLWLVVKQDSKRKSSEIDSLRVI